MRKIAAGGTCKRRGWEVEQVMGKKERNKKEYYLIKWKGYPNSEATWEPLEHIPEAQPYIDEFNISIYGPKEQTKRREDKTKPVSRHPVVSCDSGKAKPCEGRCEPTLNPGFRSRREHSLDRSSIAESLQAQMKLNELLLKRKKVPEGSVDRDTDPKTVRSSMELSVRILGVRLAENGHDFEYVVENSSEMDKTTHIDSYSTQELAQLCPKALIQYLERYIVIDNNNDCTSLATMDLNDST